MRAAVVWESLLNTKKGVLVNLLQRWMSVPNIGAVNDLSDGDAVLIWALDCLSKEHDWSHLIGAMKAFWEAIVAAGNKLSGPEELVPIIQVSVIDERFWACFGHPKFFDTSIMEEVEPKDMGPPFKVVAYNLTRLFFEYLTYARANKPELFAADDT